MIRCEFEMSGVFPSIADAMKHSVRRHRDFELGHVNGGADLGKKEDNPDYAPISVSAKGDEWRKAVVEQAEMGEGGEQTAHL